MTWDRHGEAVKRLFDRQPTEEERRRLERMLRSLTPDMRDDPGLFELLVIFNDFLVEFGRHLKTALAATAEAAEAKARTGCEAVFARAARRMGEARPEIKVARMQAFMMMSAFGILITVLVYFALIGLLKTGYLQYPHLSTAEQEQLALGREIHSLGNPEAAIWAAGAVESPRDLNEVALFTRRLGEGENALDELAAFRQCRSSGARAGWHEGRPMCSFPLDNR
jgi:hypothetical protein